MFNFAAPPFWGSTWPVDIRCHDDDDGDGGVGDGDISDCGDEFHHFQ